jgi:hypothetical protein
VVVGQAHEPLLARSAALALDHHAGLDTPLGALAPERVGTRIARVGEDLVDRLVGRLRPPHLPRAGRAPGQPAALVEQPQHHLPRAREPLEVGEHRRDRVGDRLVGRDPHPASVIVLVAGRQRQAQLALGRLVQDPAAQPAVQHVQLGLGHRALQPEQSRSLCSAG